MTSIQELKTQILLMRDEIDALYKLLEEHNIIHENIINSSYIYYNQQRAQPGSLSFIRRVCIKCRKNLSLGHFSNIERKKGPYKSICCNCIKNLHNLE